MPQFNYLSDVDVVAISVCKGPANRKRFFLRKEKADEQLLVLPGHQKLLKAEDWSAVYCVVAEPGATEDPGSADGAGTGVEDLWASDDEIRKAAWRFAQNGALVTRMHESLEPYGTVVENAIALDDFTVEGETIKKGSWYVAIIPSAEGREAIEKGEFTGISIEGSGSRTPVDDSMNVLAKVKELLGLGSVTTKPATVSDKASEEEDVETNERIEKVEAKLEDISKAQGAATEAVTGLVATVNNLIERLDAKTKKDDEEKAPSADDLKKSLDDLTSAVAEKLDKLEEGIDALAAGASSQNGDGDETIKKSAADWRHGLILE